MDFDDTKDELNFMDLPINVHTKIFSFLSSKSCQELRIVCSKWNEILDGIEMNNENFEQISKLTHLLCVRVNGLTTEFQQVLLFKESIQYLEFWDIVVSYNLIHFLKECHRVKELSFGNVTFDSHRKMRCPDGERLTLPKMKTITFHLKFHLQFSTDELILLDFLKHIQFGKLDKVIIHIPFHPKRVGIDYSGFVHALVDRQFIRELDNSHLQIELPFNIKTTGLVSFLIQNHQTVKKFVVCQGYNFHPFGHPLEEFATEDISKLQFDQLACYIRKAKGLTGNEFLMLEGQRNLRELRLDVAISCWPAVARAIGVNLFLTKVRIEIVSWYDADERALERLPDYMTFDLSAFKNCCNLTSLIWDNRYLNIGTINLSSLPKSVRKLSVWTNVMTREDVLAMARNLVNLKEAYFHTDKISQLENMPLVDDEFVQAFVSIATLEDLTLSRCKMDQNNPVNLEKFREDGFEITMYYWTSPTFPAFPDRIDFHISKLSTQAEIVIPLIP